MDYLIGTGMGRDVREYDRGNGLVKSLEELDEEKFEEESRRA